MAPRKTQPAHRPGKLTAAPGPEQRAAWLAALAEPCIAKLTYPAIMVRGRQVLASGAIQRPELTFPSADEAALLATVVGTEPYQVGVMLSGASRVSLEASCTCPHAEDGHFCKHQVALALHLRAALGGETIAVDVAAASQHAATLKRAATAATHAAARTAALHRFLTAQPGTVLAGRLMQLASESPDIRRGLLAWQATAEAVVDTPSIAGLVSELLPVHSFLDWRESNAYARSAAPVLPVLQAALQARAPGEVLQLAEQAYLRLQNQLHDADDSDGQIGGLCADVGELWLQALCRAGPQPAAFGDRYAAMRGDEVFEAIPHEQALAAMGDAAAQRYGQRLRAAFDAALAPAKAEPPPHAATSVAWGSNLGLARDRYLCHLQVSGDAPERLRVLRSGLETESDHVALIDELNRQGRAHEALDSAEQAHRLFPDAPRVQELLLALYARDGRVAEALAVRQACFGRRPSAGSAMAVLQAARQAQVAVEPLRQQMWQALIALENKAFAGWKLAFGFQAGHKPSGPDVSERLHWLMRESRFDEALALAQPPHLAAQGLWVDLALALPPRRAAAAAALLQRAFAAQMPGATSPYAGVLELVRLIADRLPGAARADWLAGLRETYRAKRNFIKGLP